MKIRGVAVGERDRLHLTRVVYRLGFTVGNARVVLYHGRLFGICDL